MEINEGEIQAICSWSAQLRIFLTAEHYAAFVTYLQCRGDIHNTHRSDGRQAFPNIEQGLRHIEKGAI